MINFPAMKKIYYVYRHIDSIKNVPFYVGIGTNNGDSVLYKRSKDKFRRSPEWKEYVKNIDYKYKIEIMFETDDYLLVNKKEREFIKLYGRKDKGLGTLLNKDNAGKGKRELPEDSLNSMISKQKCKEVIVYNSLGRKIGIFKRAQEASNYTKVPYLSIKQCLMKKQSQSKGFRFLHKEEEVDFLDSITYKKFNRGVSLECINIQTNETFIFSNMGEASKKLKVPLGTIGNNLKGTTKLAKKQYKFKYV